jgi:phosphoglycolate phosphatase-like HAD superfamily hydrolase
VRPPKIVLFDVDETLVHTGGAGAKSWMHAFQHLYGIPADIGAHTSAGETDPQVARATYRAVLHREPSLNELSRLYAAYLRYLAGEIWASESYRVLRGAQDTLVRLSDAGVVLGLVSGAMEGAARTKLGPANLNRFFVFGAYGSDSPDRAELTQVAMAKAFALHGVSLDPDEVYVVGDTPLDIAAAKKSGAVAVGVASGHFSADQLAQADADFVLGSLEDPFPGQ